MGGGGGLYREGLILNFCFIRGLNRERGGSIKREGA